MRGRHIRSNGRFEQLLELSCWIESDVVGLNKLFFVRSRTVCIGDGIETVYCVCDGRVFEWWGDVL